MTEKPYPKHRISPSLKAPVNRSVQAPNPLSLPILGSEVPPSHHPTLPIVTRGGVEYCMLFGRESHKRLCTSGRTKAASFSWMRLSSSPQLLVTIPRHSLALEMIADRFHLVKTKWLPATEAHICDPRT